MRCVLFEPNDQRAADVTQVLARARILCDLAAGASRSDLPNVLDDLRPSWRTYGAVLIGDVEDPNGTVSAVAEACDGVPILVLTREADELAQACLRSVGAADVMAWPATVAAAGQVLIARVEGLRRRAMAAEESAGSIQAGPLTVHLDGRDPEIGGRPVPVTERELRILTLLARHAGEAVARDNVSRAVLSLKNSAPADGLVDLYVEKLRRKLNSAAGGDRLISTLPGGQLRLERPQAPPPTWAVRARSA